MKPIRAGLLGEEAAAGWLEEQGFTILDRRFRVRGGEIDLVAERQRLLVFAEVKTRRSGALDDGREAVGRLKQRRLVRAARAWLARRPGSHRCRFDVLIVTVDSGPSFTVTHLPGAFDAG